MKWVTVGNTHINTNQLVLFFWLDGGLVLYHANGKNVKLKDPDRELYLDLCRKQGVRPAEEDQADE